jgi:nucleotide-binding universal stress UspA family protein
MSHSTPAAASAAQSSSPAPQQSGPNPGVEPGRRRVVVGVDGSESSIDALRWAERLAGGLGAEIDAITTWQYPTSFAMVPGLPDWDPQADAGRLLADAIRAAFGETPPPGLRAQVREGHPAAILVDAAADAELLVVGSRGHGGFAGLLLGSVSAHCTEHAACSVLVAHTKP